MIRAVVDANILVSAIIKPDSIPGTIIDLIGPGLVRSVISQEIIAEIRQVFLYPKIKKLHRLTPKLIDQALAKALGVSKYAVEHWEYGRRAVPGWVPRFLQCLEHSQPGWPPELKMD